MNPRLSLSNPPEKEIVESESWRCQAIDGADSFSIYKRNFSFASRMDVSGFLTDLLQIHNDYASIQAEPCPMTEEVKVLVTSKTDRPCSESNFIKTLEHIEHCYEQSTKLQG